MAITIGKIEGLSETLRKEFERVYKGVDDSEFHKHGLISFFDVLKAHYLIADYFMQEGEEVLQGVKDMNMLGSALGRQITGYGSTQKWNKPEEICATLFYGLIKNHAFHDANKRTALLTLLYHLHRSGKTPDVKQQEFENLAVNIARDSYKHYPRYEDFKGSPDREVLFIADFIRRSTRNIDKRSYTVTFQELNALLSKYDCYIENAGGNYADVLQKRKEKGFLGLGTTEKYHRVIQIGFPGWKKQVTRTALKDVLKATNLTEQNGIDSAVFFHGAEPLHSLIDEYRGPLMRLKDR
jgi:death-on-curing family protein